MTSRPEVSPVLGLLLAGGRSSRMGGGDKCLRSLAGSTLLARVVARAAPQVAGLLLSANGDAGRFEPFGLPVVADGVKDPAGPLAGLLAGMEWAITHRPDLPWVVTLPTDTPFLPADLVERLWAAAAGHDAACAASQGRHHHAVALWPTRLAGPLRQALDREGIRRVSDWADRYRVAVAEFVVEEFDPFTNINTPAQLNEAERWA